MKRFLNSGLTYLVVLFMILSSVSVNVWAQETSDTADSSQSRIEEKQKTSSKESLDTADELLSNDSKETKKDSSDQESASDSKKTEYTFEDAKIKVKALLKKADAISDQAELKVKEIPENTTEYKKYENALNKKSNSYSNVLLYDISFVLDGKEVEPTDGSVKVSMEFKDQQLSDDLKVKATSDLKVIHFKDNDVNKQETLKPTTNVKNETTSFETKSFSAYAVVRDGNETHVKLYKVSDFQVPDYGYGITAKDYYQSGHTETNVFVDNYNSDGIDLGSSTNYSNAGGYNYIGSFGTVQDNQIRFAQKPAKVYLGNNAKDHYTLEKDKRSSDKIWLDNVAQSNIEVKANWNATNQLNKMSRVYVDAFNSKKVIEGQEGYPDIISMTDSRNKITNAAGNQYGIIIDLVDQDAGTYLVQYDGNFIGLGFEVNIKRNQRLIVYCTNNQTITHKEYTLNIYDENKDLIHKGNSNNYVASTDQSYDWATEAVSFYMPEATGLSFAAGTSGAFIAPNATVSKGSTCGGLIAVGSFGSASSYASGEWHHHNHDLPTPDSIKFKAEKTFIDNKWPDEKSTYSVKLETINNAPMPTSSTLELSKSNPKGSFGKIEYKADPAKMNATVVYKYKVYEESGSAQNVTYDKTVYYINVEVKYSNDGSADVTKTTFSTTQNDNSGTEFDENDYFTFTNTYSTSVVANIAIKKYVDNEKPSSILEGKFTFGLKEKKNGTWSSSDLQVKKNDNNGNVSFSPIKYSAIGEHLYQVYEKNTPNKYKASGPIYVKVIISEKTDKTLKAEIHYYSDENCTTSLNNPVINNQTIGLSITKVDADKSETSLSGATFTLYKGTLNGITLTQDDSIGDEVETGSDGKATFNNLAYGSAYLLEETKAPEGYETNGPWAVQIDDNGKTTLTKISNSNDNVYTLSSNKDNIQTRDFGYTNPFEIGDKKTEYTLPSTGGSGTKAYYTIGMLVSMLCIVYVVLKKKKGGLFKEKKNL